MLNTYTQTTTGKVVAAILGSAMALSLVMGAVALPAQGQTVDELQGQIDQLMALVAQLQSQLGTVSAPTSFTFTRDLTVGSTGEDVRQLQVLLNSQGHMVASTGAGSPGNESTYFGALTRAAVSAYQAANGISPTAGYFGPITRASVHSKMATAPTTPADPTTPTAPVGQEEGTLVVKLNPTPPNNVNVKEGETKAVFAFEVEAKDSALVINRIDLNFNKRPWLRSSGMELKAGNTTLASIGANSGDFTEITAGSNYRWRASVNHTVAEGAKQVFTLHISVPSTLSASVLADVDMIVALFDSGIRATDSAGIVHFEGGDTSSTFAANNIRRIVRTGAADTGQLEVLMNSNNPKEGVAKVNETSQSSVDLLVLDVKAKKSQATVHSIIVDLETGAADVDEVVDHVELWYGSDLLASEEPTDGSNTETVTFSDLDLVINADATKTLKVVAVVAGHENYLEGETLKASVDAANIDVEDSTFATITGGDLIGTVDGENQHLYEVSPIISLVGTPSISYVGDNDDVAQASFTIQVKAEGGTIYINRLAGSVDNAVANSSVVVDQRNGNANTDVGEPVLTGSGHSAQAATHWTLNNGATMTIEVSSIIDQDTNSTQAGLQLVEFNWGTDPASAASRSASTFDWDTLGDTFRTSLITLLGV
jgi:hypothetical protein